MTSERPRTLGFAVWSEDAALVRELLSAGVDPNSDGLICNGVTPLMESVNEPEAFYDEIRQSVTRMLLEAGAEVGLTDTQGRTALHYAARAGAEVVNLLIRAGAEVDAADLAGNTPLHEASDAACVGAIETLVRAGANADMANHEGITARGPLLAGKTMESARDL
ncbi:MAG: ankyrin repeat domain-containing protein [Nocardioidaceae bacterium]|nr:ankyrin repeat domain-containing protein [Nocardioidaceae bacterium]MCL2612188.1 ankyrin repeat domain-containing protein [Nocardioidaceae bacterium]